MHRVSVVSSLDPLKEIGRAGSDRPLALFVYGTLAPGEVNGHVLGGLTGSWTEAKVRGNLCDAGWGASLGFPGLRLFPDTVSSSQASGDYVSGLLFESEGLSELWVTLDAFEGAEYRCKSTEAILQDGRAKPCVVYAVETLD